MKYKIILTFLFLVLSNLLFAQKFNNAYNRDSVFHETVKDLPKEKVTYFTKLYQEGNKQSQDFFLFMLCLPRSSKGEMIDNYELRVHQIEKLKKVFLEKVPDSLIVFIEIDPGYDIFTVPPSIDLHIYRKDSEKLKSNIQERWNSVKDTTTLNQRLKIIGWGESDFLEIKKLLIAANCISIENNEITTIGFARNGMGKYFYLAFDKDLSEKEINKYNDGCSYIFYRKNLVLNYQSGAIGSLCFPDE